MRSLSDHDIIRIWEEGQNQHPLDKALTILSFCYPEMTRDQLASLSIGQRDQYLIELLEKTFGSSLKGFAECPQCGEYLEFAMTTDDIPIPLKPDLPGKKAQCELKEKKLKIKFRMPNSKDMAAIVECENIQSATKMLIQQCVLEVTKNAKSIKAKDLLPDVINKISDFMANYEPQAEILLALQCPACTHGWQMMFDIVAFIWKKISVRAKRLMYVVHSLASAYKWKEEDILSMSSIKRQHYLDMVS